MILSYVDNKWFRPILTERGEKKNSDAFRLESCSAVNWAFPFLISSASIVFLWKCTIKITEPIKINAEILFEKSTYVKNVNYRRFINFFLLHFKEPMVWFRCWMLLWQKSLQMTASMTAVVSKIWIQLWRLHSVRFSSLFQVQ